MIISDASDTDIKLLGSTLIRVNGCETFFDAFCRVGLKDVGVTTYATVSGRYTHTKWQRFLSEMKYQSGFKPCPRLVRLLVHHEWAVSQDRYAANHGAGYPESG